MKPSTKSSTFSFTEADMPIRFGRYLLLRTKNSDAVGEEFLAVWGVDEGVDQLRVVRGIYPSVAEDAKFVRVFSEEARSLSRLASQNVVRVLEVDGEGGIPFVASEHVEGITLSRMLELTKASGEACPWEISVHIAAEMLRGLDYVHRREDILGHPMGMKHGDVRPPNVVVSFDGEVKLTNFGSALDYIADEKTNARVQTYRGIYAPPEHSSEEGATQEMDLWGVAACLSVILGREDTNVQGTPTRYREDEEVAKKLDAFLDKCLIKEKKDRYPDAPAMRSVLLGIMEEHAAGHPIDGLSDWIKRLGESDRKKEEQVIRDMIGQDSQLDLTETTDDKKLGPGVVIDGRYHLIKQLGEGGMGVVFAADHLGIGRKVALKILHDRVLDDATAVERFRREAQIMGSLKHPNIVHVSDFGVTTEGYHYLVMDLLEGESLSERIEKGRIDPTETATVMAEVCDGLAAAHDAGVIHRDLKPENVFLTESSPQILDFGIAKRTGIDIDQSLTNTGFLCGTAEYMAPESIGGMEPDARTDIYAVGVMIYEALTQKTPYRGRTIGETLHKVMIDKLVPPRKRSGDRTIPKSLETACLKALERNPNKRFESAKEMADALRAAVGKPVKSLVRSTPKKKEGGWNSRLWATLVVTVVVAAATVYGIVHFARPGDDDGGTEVVAEANVPADGPVVEITEVNTPDEEPAVKVLIDETESGEAKAITAEPDIVDNKSSAPERNPQNDAPVPEPAPSPEEITPKPEAVNPEQEKLDALIKEGHVELQKMNIAAAQDLFKEALELNPGSSKARYALGKAAFEKGDYPDAVKQIERALTIAPQRHRWRVYLGKVHMAMGHREQAIADWKAVLEKDPSNEEALAMLEAVGAG